MNNENIQKTPGTRKKVALAVIAVLVIAVIVIVLLLLKTCDGNTPDVGDSGTGDYLKVTYNGKNYEYNGRITTICLTGLDTTEKISGIEAGEADADMVMLIVVDEYSKKVSVIAFDRNILLSAEAGVLKDAYKGGDSVSKAVSALVRGIPVTYNYTMNMSAIPMMHGLVNEFEVTVPNNDLAAFAKDSKVKLTADNVTSFVRDLGASGDKGRMERQEAYMRGFFKMALDAATASNVQNVLDAAETCANSENVNTDIPKAKYGDLLSALGQVTDVNFYTVSGEYTTVNGQTQCVVDADALLATLVNVFYHEK